MIETKRTPERLEFLAKKRIYDAKWREKNRERVRECARKYNRGKGRAKMRTKDLRVRYGLTPEQYRSMLDDQNGTCAICGKSAEQNGKRLSIDHCHETGIVRGLLCYRCNTGLASFKDSPQMVERALDYLAARAALAKAEGK
jgi:hypothetical protein